MSKKQGECENGCDAPICPPSKVICRGCMDRITANLEAMLKRSAEAEEERRQERIDELRAIDEDHRCLAYTERGR